MGIEHSNHVPGAGPADSGWMVVGEGPGWKENLKREPFVGDTGDEMRRFMDGIVCPKFEDIFRTNLYRYYGGKDYVYTDEDFARDEPELLQELARCQPKVIVAVGRYAARYFLGDIDMEGVHGLPWYLPDDSRARQGTTLERVVVFPTYHPAAGMRNPEMAALVAADFASLAQFADDALKPRVYGADPLPHPQYFHVTGSTVLQGLELTGVRDIAEDSEGSRRRPWSLQWAAQAGTGYLVRATSLDVVSAYLEWLVAQQVRATFHSALHDRPVRRAFARLCGWSEARILFELDTLPFDDTMIMAYLLQVEPQGLKALALRHCNMLMQSYLEVIGDAQDRLAQDWLAGTWQVLDLYHTEAQEAERVRVNATPLRDRYGNVRTAKDGSIRCRRTSKLPSLPKSGLYRAVERCLRSKRPYGLWFDQNEDIQVDGYTFNGPIPEASLSHVDFETAKTYGCRDADATARVKPELQTRLQRMGLEHTYALEVSTYPLIDRMGEVGMKPNLQVFARLSQMLAGRLADVQLDIEKKTGIRDFNANSGDQVADYLYGRLGLEPLKMTRGGEREPRGSTNDMILEVFEKEHGQEYPVIADFRNYREYFKLKHTFVDRVPAFIQRHPFDGRVHATFRTTRVITGRLSASDPNILAQPEHGDFAPDFKAGWVAEDGHLVCNWDLSQIELRVLAHLSQDPVLMRTYLFECPHSKDWQSGKTFCRRNSCVLKGDLHASLAHTVFGLQPDQQDDHKHRFPAKAHNFGLPMGMTCHGLMIQLRRNGVEVDESGAQEWIDASNKLYRLVPVYKLEKAAEARRNGFVRCLSGRIRYIGGIRNKDERVRSEAERFAFSTPIQEGATWIAKTAQALMWDQVFHYAYRQGYYKGGSRGRWVEPLCWVHDALKAEVAEEMVQTVHPLVVSCMTTQVGHLLSVPIGVEGKSGPNFARMERFQ